MKYSEVVKTAKKKVSVLDASKIHDHLAIEFDVEGDGEGAFYVELSDGKVQVEPYEYYDNDGKVTASADVILALLSGKLSAEEALAQGSVSVEGDGGKVMMLANALKVKAEKKAPATQKKATKKTTKKK